jgi:hypothetical protein
MHKVSRLLKKLSVQDKQLTGIACGNGKGGVTLVLTSSTSTQHWDLVAANPLDTKIQMKWFQAIESAKDEDYKQLFDTLPVKALTMKQNTP